MPSGYSLYSFCRYTTFGSVNQNRSFACSAYRYGFNGKENDDEVKGGGNQQDYGMRIYDPRLGRFLSIDPLTKEYPWYTPYQFAGNKPIKFIDIDGSEEGERAAKAGAALAKATSEMINAKLKANNIGPEQSKVIKANLYDAYNSQYTKATAEDVQFTAFDGANRAFDEGGPGDAFRHTLWNALMTKESNSDFAQKLGFAHEQDSQNSPAQRAMDLLNNQIGQKIANDNPKASTKELSLLVLENINNGKSYMVEKDKNGKETLVKSHIDKKDYQAAKKRIEAIDDKKLNDKVKGEVK
jgi:RHS repeat-associated protein